MYGEPKNITKLTFDGVRIFMVERGMELNYHG